MIEEKIRVDDTAGNFHAFWNLEGYNEIANAVRAGVRADYYFKAVPSGSEFWLRSEKACLP